MFEASTAPASGAATPVDPGTPLDAAEIALFLERLQHTDRHLSDAERVDQLTLLESLTGAAAAAQAVLSVDLHTSVREHHADLGMPPERQGAGVAAQIGLARRESPNRASNLLGFAHAVVEEMPHTFARFREGLVSEWRARLLVRETACLSREHRQVVDEELMSDPERSRGWGDQTFVAEAKKLAYLLDPMAALRRTRKAEADRRVTCRPAPDTMASVHALLPVRSGVAVFAALDQEAKRLKAAGDERSRGQIMADLLVERVTGRPASSPADLEVQVVLSDATLLGSEHQPGHLVGFGPVPAPWARDLVLEGLSDDERVILRRLWAAPDTGRLVAMESTASAFPQALRRFLDSRDQFCRTPWCEAPIRHTDHVRPRSARGPTTADNGQGLCEACNYAKSSPGWRAVAVPDDPVGRHTVVTTTPTGHRYRSTAPPAPGHDSARAAAPRTDSPAERYFVDWVLTA